MFKKQTHMTRRLWMSVIGVVLCGIGVGFFKAAAFGVDPFQSLMAGLHEVIPISFGLLYLLANLVLLLFSLICDRSKIGLATIINLTLLGYIVDFSHQTLLGLLPCGSMPVRLTLLAVGLVILSISCSLYITADLGVSTYDAVALVGHDRWPKLPFAALRVLTDLVCVGLGVGLFLASGQPAAQLGQVAGIGTILTAFCLGPLIELCNRRFSRKLLNR